jgi:hypothetical protein
MDQILLIGGSTLISRVRERVTDFFGRDPATGVSPFEAVALGAAIQAYAMTEAAPADETTNATAASVRLSRTVVTLRPPPPVLERSDSARQIPLVVPAAPAAAVIEHIAVDFPRSSPESIAAPRIPKAARAAWWPWAVTALAVALVVVGVAILLR